MPPTAEECQVIIDVDAIPVPVPVPVTPAEKTIMTKENEDIHQSNHGEFSSKESRDMGHEMDRTYTPAESAYVQNLAEMCHAILNDMRWRTIRQEHLLSWHRGVDLSAAVPLSRLFQETNNQTNNNHETITSESLAHERAIHLYTRLYYRKGPWFRLDDLYKRYYHIERNKTDSIDNHEAENDSPSNEEDETENDDPTDSDTNDWCCKLEELIQDMRYLRDMGLVRSFDSVEECASVAVDKQLLTSEDRWKLLRELGYKRNGKQKARAESSSSEVLLKHIQCQPRLAFSFGHSQSRMLPVQKHLDNLIFQKLASHCLVSQKKQQLSSNDEFDTYLQRMWRECDGLCCVRLREAPYLALQRIARLYLCATAGPGNMRGPDVGCRVVFPPSLASHVKDAQACHETTKKWMKQCSLTPPVPPPLLAWHTMIYPGLSHRFRLSSFPYANQIRTCRTHHIDSCIFETVHEFNAWELAIEIRANLDYLVEINDLIQSSFRRIESKNSLSKQATMKRSRSSEGDSQRSGMDDSDFQSTLAEDTPSKEKGSTSASQDEAKVYDSYDLLSQDGRAHFIRKIFSIFVSSNGSQGACRAISSVSIAQSVEDMIESNFFKRDSNGKEKKTDCFLNDAERICAVLCIICLRLLWFRLTTMTEQETYRLTKRPWLRHLCWESVLSYIIWDCIPILEKRKCHGLACNALETLLLGKCGMIENENPVIGAFVQVWLSRRVRGKAYERIIIDQTHVLRTNARPSNQEPKISTVDTKKKRKRKGATISQEKDNNPIRDFVQNMCVNIIQTIGLDGSIGFSAIRNIARRLQVPLAETMNGIWSMEMMELGLRLENEGLSSSTPGNNSDKKQTGYRDWAPITDVSVATAIVSGSSLEDNTSSSTAGSRCSYIGWEQNQDEIANIRSLNVEQLALEEYYSGRLPLKTNDAECDSVLGGGGWLGWHNEGGHVRVLFRILCSGTLFGHTCIDDIEAAMTSLFLTPYQAAPFDLHVGYRASAYVSEEGSTRAIVPCLYERQRRSIESFLAHLEGLNAQALSNLVHQSIVNRRTEGHVQDVQLRKDTEQIRTLSMLAAGFGGVMLAAMFRCLLFDYRHYSGGLPDCLLVRALYDDSEGKSGNQVLELNDWIGESFNDSKLQSTIVADEEFLGCTKTGDSASGGSRGRRGQPHANGVSSDNDCKTIEDITSDPEPLSLVHNGRTVKVQCMFVEVKSANDRLDARQEDWLNVLDRVGHARVCKFENGRTKSRLHRKPSKK
eukprot:scaffold3453_cov54-Attheya_sp.AAC.6